MSSRDQVGKLFYNRLFDIAPDTRAMFKGSIDQQARKLMETLALAIASLRDTPTLVATLEALAKRHVGYGVRDEHYDKVGEALLWTLQQGLGDAFTPHAREAWTALYGTVADVMRRAVAGQSGATAAA
jgi:nitric oxide dioxygenase